MYPLNVVNGDRGRGGEISGNEEKTNVQDDKDGSIIPKMISMLLRLLPNGTLGCMVSGRIHLLRILS